MDNNRRHAPPIPPPRNAHDLRSSILARLEHYRGLQTESAQNRGNHSQQVDPDGSRAITLGMVQKDLLSDIYHLSTMTLQLERKAREKRLRKWFINGCLAVLSHLFYIQLFRLPGLSSWSPFRQRNELGQHRPQIILTVLTLLPWTGYAVAGYRILSHETRINKMVELRTGLAAVDKEVRDSLPVWDTSFLEDSVWDRIPWGI